MKDNSDKYKADGAYRRNEARRKLDRVITLAGLIDPELSRVDSDSLRVVLELLSAIQRRQYRHGNAESL